MAKKNLVIKHGKINPPSSIITFDHQNKNQS